MLGKFTSGLEFLEALTSADNTVRVGTEEYMKQLKASNSELLFSYCLEGLQQPKPGIIQMALFVIKKNFVGDKNEVPASKKEQLTTLIVSIAQTLGSKVLMNIGAEILCGMAVHDKGYQTLLQQLVQICQSPDSKLRK